MEPSGPQAGSSSIRQNAQTVELSATRPSRGAQSLRALRAAARRHARHRAFRRLEARRHRHARASAAPAAAAPAGGGPDWAAIAACESGGNWGANTGNGYWGGLQFLPATWFAFGGGPFDGRGPFPYSPAAQIRVAQRVYAAAGPGQWPVCFRAA